MLRYTALGQILALLLYVSMGGNSQLANPALFQPPHPPAYAEAGVVGGA